jgi:hypothetical protein
MSQKFKIGDRVRVLQDEGYDLKPESQGKMATIVGLVGESEFRIVTDDGVDDVAAFYHIIPLPNVRNPYLMDNQVLDLDPDLHGYIVQVMHDIPELQHTTFTTALLVLAHLGYDVIQDNPNILKGSLIVEK